MIIVGNSSGQSLAGGPDSDTIYGAGGNDQLYGLASNDTLFGGDGNDFLDGGVGYDLLNGGAGTDAANYNTFGSVGVVANLATGTAFDGISGTDSLVAIENVYGGFAGDTLTGDSNANFLVGNEGVDTLFGGGGNDELSGGLGNDTLYGGSGDFDLANFFGATVGINATVGNSTVVDGLGGIDRLFSIEGFVGSNTAGDRLTGNGSANRLHGLGGNDTLFGGGGNDLIYGGGGDDTMNGGAGADYFQGSAGNDTIVGGGLPFDYDRYDRALDYDIADYLFGATGGIVVDLAAGTVFGNGSVGIDTLVGIEQVYGTSFSDTFHGGGPGRFEAFRGGAGNDTIIGSGEGPTRAIYSDSTGGVTIALSGAADGLGTVSGGSTGTDIVRYVSQFYGSTLSDRFDASAYIASMPDSGNGFNAFRGDEGNDTIIGNGNTRMEFTNSTAGVTVDLGLTTAADGLGGIDTYSGIDQIRGSGHTDVLIGTAANEAFDGRAGDDTIYGGAGSDRVNFDQSTAPITIGITVNMSAGTAVGDPVYNGTDTFFGIEAIGGSLLDDLYIATGFAGGGNTGTFRDGPLVNVNFNRFTGASGNDTIVGNGQTQIDYSSSSSGITLVYSGQGTGTATGEMDGTDSFSGIYSVNDTPFDDRLTGSNAAVADYWEGFNLRGGNDSVIGGGGNDFLNYNSTSNAAINLVFTGAGSGTVAGNGTDRFSGIELVFGSIGNDTMSGGTGNETLAGIGGNDSLNGGAGGADAVDYFPDVAGVTVDLGLGTAHDGFGGFDTLANFEIVMGSVFADTVTGSNAAETLLGAAGNDRLVGGGGNDLLRGGAGKDILDGGANVDTADYADKTAAVAVTLAGATNASVTIGGVAEDTIRNIENVIGGSAADTLTGDTRANRLTGGAGNDVLRGGAGNDILDGGANVDTADYADKTASVAVTLAGATNASVTIGGVAEDTIRNIENVIGGSAADTLTGDARANRLTGGAGNDILRGGAGKDILDGGANVDTADYSDKTASVAVTLAGASNASVTIGGVAEDTIRNIENVIGGSAADTLTGNALANRLAGGAGNDTLTGGAGNDAFVFDTALGATNIDLIADFNVSVDNILLESAVFSALAAGPLAAGAFFIGATAQDADDRIVYNSLTGALIYDTNGSAAGGSTQFAQLSTGLALTANNFLIT